MKSLLFDKILSIISKKDYTRFHTPGHKGNSSLNIDWFQVDLTEIPGTDNLMNPSGILKDVMEDIADIYGVKKSFLLVNGSTVGILSAILSTTKPGDEFIIPRNSHRSVYSSLIINRIKPVYIYEKLDMPYPIISPLDVERAFLENPMAKGIIITSPTYYGVCLDVKSISEVTNKYNKILIVDEAHGAHLKFYKDYPKSSVELGADIVIQSTHKTLNSFNQGALLHLCSNKVDGAKVAQYINMLQTSSPSYPIMISIEESVKECFNNGAKILNKIIDYYDYVNESLKETDYFLISEKLLKEKSIYDFDKIKLWINSGGLEGSKLANILRFKYNIQVEMWDKNSILAMMGMGTKIKDVLRLVEALKEIKSIKYSPIEKDILNYPKAKYRYHPSEVMQMPKEQVILEESHGKVSADFIIPYPPGIPLLVPGEIISREIIEYIKNSKNAEIIGIKDGLISVIVKEDIYG